jgi:hypothetical protein
MVEDYVEDMDHKLTLVTLGFALIVVVLILYGAYESGVFG